MTRTVINLDDELVAQASEIFGTTTKVSTVNAALKDVVDRERRKQFVQWVMDGGLELDSDEIRERAW
ncbi:type II toxin-antitoxin system VapB family antitoxin [Glycomyces arizonensis]|uniref:type II toxin-antitoxin system VapB family antitoxin n=1 Tax=Glycomyces arizonensis TaxID=256035 RepID=UPI00047C97A4|nr:type II toxin-antitoxin system VapB family antitoxin [Glycomyces arizonensis]